MSEKQVKDYDKFVLRLPEGMREAIADLAKANGRSMNAEIVQILKDALTHHSFDSIASKESLKNMPIDVRLGLIEKRTIIARAQIAKAMKDIDDNLELLANKDAPISEEELAKIISKPLYYDKDAAKRASDRELENKKNSKKPT